MQKMQRASFEGPFSDADLPQPMPHAEMAQLVDRLRQGDSTVKATIIANHMRLAMSVVTKFSLRYASFLDDMIGAAMMGIVQAVEWAPTRLYDNNIAPYIYATVERHIRDVIEHRFPIDIPRGQFKTLMEEKEAFVPLIQYVSTGPYDEENPTNHFDYLDDHAAKVVEEHPLLFEEFLESLALNHRERTVVNLILEDYKQTEIAKIMDVSDEYVHQIRMKIKEKILRIRRSDVD